MPPLPYHREFGHNFRRRGLVFRKMNHVVIDAARIDQIKTYDEFRQALNQRRVALGLTMQDLDERTGLADGYSSKILGAAPSRFGRYCRNIGPVAMDCLLPALKVRIRLEPIDD